MKINKFQLTFLGIGILLSIIVIGYSAISIRFLIQNLDQALNKKYISPTLILKFENEKAEILLRKTGI